MRFGYIVWILCGAIVLLMYFSYSKKNVAFSIGGDSFASLAYFEKVKKNIDLSSTYGQPFFSNAVFIPNPIFFGINRSFSFITPNQAYYFNLHVMFGVLSAFVVSYGIGLTALKEGANRSIISLFFAILVSFSSFNLMHYFTGHLNFLLVFQLLWFYIFFVFYRRPNTATSLLLGAVTAIGTVCNAYYGYFNMLLSLYIVFYRFCFERREIKRFVCYFLLCALVAVLIVGSVMYPVLGQILTPTSQPLGSGFNRTFASLGGVVPWMYLLPSPQHFLSPEWYVDFYRNVMMIVNVPENAVYLGWFNIVFFVYGAFLFVKKRLSPVLHDWYRFLIGAAGFCFLLSMPPFIPLGGGKTFYWVTTYLHKLFPMFRIYNRLGLFVLFFVTIGALIGFDYFLKKYRAHRRIIVVIGLLFIVFELTPRIPLLDLNHYPEVYDWLKKQPGDFIVYEIPEAKLSEREKDEFVFYKYQYYQNIHGKRLFNRAPVKADMQSREFYEKLKKWKVKYIVQHRNLYDEGLIPREHKKYVHPAVAKEKYNEGVPEKLPDWYKVETEIGDSVVYSVR